MLCSKMLLRLRVTQAQELVGHSPHGGRSTVLRGECSHRGLMSAELLQRMLSCTAIFYGPGKGPLIVFSSSVSQLQPVGSGARTRQSQCFEEHLFSFTPLFINRQQFKDAGCVKAVTYLQFNKVTDELNVMNPEYDSEMSHFSLGRTAHDV